jgi:AcrR family transcriptional regulator
VAPDIREDSAAPPSPTRVPRKKLRTRQRIIAVARGLVATADIDALTLAQIAAAADIHVTTLFTHFRSKHELLAALSEPDIEQLERVVADAQGRVPFREFLRRTVGYAAAAYQRAAREAKLPQGSARLHPALLPSWLHYEQRQTELFTHYIAADYGLHPTRDARPRLIAGMIVTAIVDNHERWQRGGCKGNLLRTAQKMLDAIDELVLLPLGTPTSAAAVPDRASRSPRRARPT